MAAAMIGAGRPLAFGPDGASLGRWGTLLPAGRGRYRIRNPSGGMRELDYLPSDLRPLEGWFDEPAGLLIMCGTFADVLVVADLGLDELATSVALDRQANVGVRFNTLFRVDDHQVACLYEHGLVAIGDDGAESWHVAHGDVSVRLDHVDGDLIRLERQLPPVAGSDRFTVRATDGHLIAEPS